jgi:hypothetical protein
MRQLRSLMRQVDNHPMTERIIENAAKEYINLLPDNLFIVNDLHKAVVAGVNYIAKQDYPYANEIAEGYTEEKPKDCVYSGADIVRAYKAGAKIMLGVKEREQEQIKRQIRLTKAELQKLAKLICTCEQLMELADNLNMEAEKILTKHDLFKQKIKSDWKDIAKKFGSIKSQLNKTFREFTEDEWMDWADEGELIEDKVREIMKIDIYEDYEAKRNGTEVPVLCNQEG